MIAHHAHSGEQQDVVATRDASPFHQELAEVDLLLRNSFVDLYPPLSDLAESHLRRVQPYLRAAIVIAAGIGSHEEDSKRPQRVALAAALEMQAIALSIHRLLLEFASEDGSIDRSVLGSTILTGDYCFSRAAVLATHTDSPRVVAIFSQALRTISEGHLRRLLENGSTHYDEDRELMSAGVRAAGELVDLSAPAQQTAQAYIDVALSFTRDNTTRDRKPFPSPPTNHLSAAQQARWCAFVRWLPV
jgi:octaprenyl-diphosphate synthase